jgi:AcrR family transcriptional regulator
LSTKSSASTNDTAQSTDEVLVRPPRADARRNRKKVLEVAREVFASAGQDAQIDEVARRAGVGIGTVYRHFPTKEALLDAIVLDAFDQLTASARRALDDPDPWRGFSTFVRGAVSDFSDQRALGDVSCSAAMEAEGPIRAALDAMLATIEALLNRAQAAGDVRSDITSHDLERMLLGLARTPLIGDEDPVASRERWLSVILDGLKASGQR